VDILATVPAKCLSIQTLVYSSGNDSDCPHEKIIHIHSLRKGNHSLNFSIDEPTPFQITEIEICCRALFFDNTQVHLHQTLGDCSRLLIFTDQDVGEKKLRFSGWPRRLPFQMDLPVR
jgi:hypothetical protein